MRRAVFLDRDGVLNELVWNPQELIWDSPYCLEDFKLIPGVAEAICRIQGLGFLAIVVSNQPGVAKQKCTPAFLEALNYKMVEELHLQEARLDGIYYCLHHPEAKLSRLRIVCDCRKPQPGLLFRAAQEHQIDLVRSFLIGDGERDIEAGLKAGCTTLWVKSPEQSQAHFRARDVTDAISKIENLLKSSDLEGLSGVRK